MLDYRGDKVTQNDCKIFECTCDNKKFDVVAADHHTALDLLKKYIKGNRYTSKFSGKYYISMLENEVDAIIGI